MKIVLSSAEENNSTEMSVEQLNQFFEISIYDHNDDFSQTIRIDLEEANELIKYLQEKMKF